MNMKRLMLAASIALCALGTAPVHAESPAAKSAHAFYLVEFELTDPEGIRPYSAQVESTFRPFGGRFVVRGGKITSLEGDAPKGKMVLIEFDSAAQAHAWYDSPAYQAIIPIRHRSAKSRALIVEGVPVK